MKFKVCILAAGIGSRMGLLTKKISKTLLPIDSKAVLSHIIEKFNPNVEIVIAVGHLKETITEYLACAHVGRKIQIVEVDKYTGTGSGPGFSLLQCRPFLEAPFIFFASDTLVLEDIPPPTTNWLGVAPVLNTKDYCSAAISNGLITRLDDKIESVNRSAFIGLAGVKDYEIFFNSLEKDTEIINEELQVSNGFKSLIDLDLNANYFTWYDTGNMKGYVHANEEFTASGYNIDFSKPDEFLYFVGNNVIKFFADKKIVKNRYKRSKILKDLCPEIIHITNSFYAYEKQEGKVLYDIVNDRVMKNFIQWLDKQLWDRKVLSGSDLAVFQKACFDFYYKKTLSRLNTYHKKHSIKDQTTLINEVRVPSIKHMLGLINWDEINYGIPSNFHGDLQFDNVLLKDDGSFLLLDWRQDFSRIVDYGDQYYDISKLNGGLQVSYKLVKQDQFRFYENDSGEITVEHNLPEELVSAKKILNEFVEEKNLDMAKIEIMTSLIYLNMSPMHHAPFNHFIYNFGKLSLYKALLKYSHLGADSLQHQPV